MRNFLLIFLRKNLAPFFVFFVSYLAYFWFGLLVRDDFVSVLGSEIRLRSLAATGIAGSFFYLMYRGMQFYLDRSADGRRQSIRPGPSYNVPDERVEKAISNLESRLDSLGSQINKAVTDTVARTSQQPSELFKTEVEIQEFKRALALSFVQEATKNIQTDIVEALGTDSKFKAAEEHQNQIIERLYRVVSGLERRANLNLAVGATIGAAGIGVLIYLLYISPPVGVTIPPDYVFLTLQYTSRVSIVLLIEVFAFFFLKLYSQTLGELRYTHNEITNVQMKQVGLQAAVASTNKTSIAKAIERAIETERNFVLEKGKTTVDLERYRHEEESARSTLATLKEILDLKSVISKRETGASPKK